MMRKIATIWLVLVGVGVSFGAGFGLSSAALAADRPVVVELYTSQGCSSCPPADAFFRDQLAKQKGVIALSLHVDYWDYIGWKDAFASPAFTKRQRDYARAAGHRSVYTPQLIIGGTDHVIGTKPGAVRNLVKSHAKAKSEVTIEAKRRGDTVTIDLKCATPMDERLMVQLVRFKRESTVNIKRGENAGRTITYANIVTSWDMLGEWDTRKPLEIMAPVMGNDEIVILVQRKGHGAIEAALQLN
jgi:hypothetical protein